MNITSKTGECNNVESTSYCLDEIQNLRLFKTKNFDQSTSDDEKNMC